jgi:hypothetical protein
VEQHCFEKGKKDQRIVSMVLSSPCIGLYYFMKGGADVRRSEIAVTRLITPWSNLGPLLTDWN